LVTSRPVIALGNELRVTVHDKVCIVAREYELSLLFRLPDLRDDLQHNRIVEVLFRWSIIKGGPTWLRSVFSNAVACCPAEALRNGI
jgi:hypothetical protein